MTKEQTLAPKLRFGNSEEYGPLETVVFDELFVFSQGKNIKQKEAAPHFKTPCVRYGELYHMYSEVITEVINRTNLDPAELRFSEGNEILLPSAGEDPLDIGSASALMLKGVAIGRTINVLQPKCTREYDQRFASYYINRVLRKRISQLARGASISNVYNTDLRELTIRLPPLAEQVKIAEFLTSLDRMIGLHQRKHDKLVTLKQAMLQKMFPQDGATTPQIRFKGFEGDWDRKTVGDLATFSKGQGYSKKDLRKEGVPIILYGRLYTAYETEIANVDTFADEQDGSVKSEGNEVIVPSSGETSEDIARASAVTQSGVILGGDLNVIKPCDDLDPCFLALTLSYGKPQKDLAQKAQGKSVVHVRNSDIEPLEIPVPDVPEQQRIGNYFRKIDVLISKHATQLEKLKNIKSACLEKMFV